MMLRRRRRRKKMQEGEKRAAIIISYRRGLEIPHYRTARENMENPIFPKVCAGKCKYAKIALKNRLRDLVRLTKRKNLSGEYYPTC